MNHIFLYAARDTSSFRQAEQMLQQFRPFDPLLTMPPGSRFTSSVALALRGNDIIIVYIEKEEDIEELLPMIDEFESFRIVLLLPDEGSLASNRFLQLSPRFIAVIANNMDELSIFLSNSINKIGPTGPLHTSKEEQ